MAIIQNEWNDENIISSWVQSFFLIEHSSVISSTSEFNGDKSTSGANHNLNFRNQQQQQQTYVGY